MGEVVAKRKVCHKAWRKSKSAEEEVAIAFKALKLEKQLVLLV